MGEEYNSTLQTEQKGVLSMLLNLLFSRNIDFMSVIVYIISSLLVIFLVLPFHEFAHGFVAYKLGDRTAKNSGRLSLNPIAHIDYMGAMLLLIIGFGWAKPVPIDDRNFKNPKAGMAITALAGPVANLIAAIVAGLLCNTIIAVVGITTILTSMFWQYVILFFQYLMIINTSLAVFNLIPIPPLDGSKILMAFLPDKVVYKIYQYERYFSVFLFVIIMIVSRSGILTGIQNIFLDFIQWLTALPFGF